MSRGQWWIAVAIAGALVVLFLLATSGVIAQSPDQNGDEYLVYLPLVAKEYDPTWVWREGITATLQPDYEDILMAIDRQGRIHLVWDPFFSPKFIYHSYLTSSGWTSPTVVARSSGTSDVLQPPFVGLDGVIHLLWRNRETSSEPYRLLYAAFASGYWTLEEEAFQSQYSTLISAPQGVLNASLTGVVYATVVDCGLFSCDAYHISRQNSWKTATRIDGFQYSLYEGSYGKAWPDRVGGAHLYVNQTSNYNLLYSYWRNGQFQMRDRLIGKVRITLRETFLDGTGNLHIFWLDKAPIPGGEVTGLYHQCVDQNLVAHQIEVLSGYNSAQYVVGATDYFGWTALAWQESDGNTRRIRLGVWNGCSRVYLKTVPTSRTTPRAVAISDTPRMVCVLNGGYSVEILCANMGNDLIYVDPVNH